jgi:hypothetical protein
MKSIKTGGYSYLSRQWLPHRLLFLLVIFMAGLLAVVTEAHDCGNVCGPDVSCGTECLDGSSTSTCGEAGQQCYNPFGGCSEVCGSHVSCNTACNDDSDGVATTCGAIGADCSDGGEGNSAPPTSPQGGSIGSMLTDLASRCPTSQSSTAVGGRSSRAVDLNTDGVYTHGSVTHTDLQDNPQWRVEITPGQIGIITIFNRTDCCGDRLRGANVWVRRFSTSEWEHVTTLESLANVYSVNVGTHRGAYKEVAIVRDGRSRYLSLAEVTVIGIPIGAPCPR